MFFQFLIKFFEQLYMEGIATIIAAVIGIAIGILASYSSKLKIILLWIAKCIQTIPSFALLSLLLPIVGIGVNAALIVLVIYAMLPIAFNTLSGLSNVSPKIIDAAQVLGFSKIQRLFIIELPLAFPLIMVGIKTAAMISVGIATLASLAGAGGFGDFIFEGLELNNTYYILLGSIPAALMAIGVDLLIDKIEIFLIKNKFHFRHFFLGFLFVITFIFLLIIGNYWLNKKTIVVASKNYTEQVILGEIIAQKIESETPFKVIRKFNLGSTAVCHNALLSKHIDIYPEYSGTAYTIILKNKYNAESKALIFDTVKNNYEKKYQSIWLNPLGFNNEYAVIVNKNLAQEYHLKNISDLKLIAHKLILGLPHDIFKRPDGFDLLKNVYDLRFSDVKLFNVDLLYQAIKMQKINVIFGGKTDGRMLDSKFTILIDDKHVFPPYEPSIVIRKDTVKSYPEILNVLNTLSYTIDIKTMKCLNNLVNEKKLTPYHVAHDFLTEHCCRKNNQCFYH